MDATPAGMLKLTCTSDSSSVKRTFLLRAKEDISISRRHTKFQIFLGSSTSDNRIALIWSARADKCRKEALDSIARALQIRLG